MALQSICWKPVPTCAPSNCCSRHRSLATTARYLRIATSKVCATQSPLDLLPPPVATEPEPAPPQYF
jgi:hypothetical protein